MINITISPINHYNLDKQLNFQMDSSFNIGEVYESYKSMLVGQSQIDNEDQMPDFEQVVVYQKQNPKKKLHSKIKIASLNKNDIKLAIIFPIENCPIIECKLGEDEFFIYYYTKSDKLNIIGKDENLSTFIAQQNIERITINEVQINYSAQKMQPIKKFIENHVNSNIKIVIYASQINKVKKQAPPKKQSIKVEVPQKKVEEPLKKQPIPPKNQAKVDQIKPHQLQSQDKKLQIKYQPKKEVQILKKIQQKKLQNKVSKNPDQLSSPQQIKSIVQPNNLQLILKFEVINGGRMQCTKNVDRSKSFQQLLPSIIQELKSNGFDWNDQEYKHTRDWDKLNVLCDNFQFKKIDKPLKQLIGTNEPRMTFSVERHYEGG